MSEKTNVEEPKLCVRLEKCKLEGCAGSEEENDTCNCLDSLDIFERCVQDPCSEAWEDLDEDGTECALDDTDGVEEFGIDDNELDPLQEGVECSVGDSKRTRAIGNRRERESESRCANCQKLRRWKTCGSPVDSGEPVLRCSRTNSFMSQLSRQASRQSLPDAVDAQETSPASRSRSRSSFSGGNAIPTHLYCLERFVSSELDSAAELFFKGEQTADELSAVSPVASIASQGSPNPLRAVTSTSSSCLNSPGNAKEAKSPTDTMPTLLSRRKSRMSSIEISLLNSLS